MSLEVHLSDSEPGGHAQGFRRVLVTEADHPFWKYWWPHGHIIGWEHTFVHEIHPPAGRHRERHGCRALRC